MAERHVKLFRNGRNQAIRIPREFELPGEDAIMHKDGERLIIEPIPPRSLLAMLATLKRSGSTMDLLVEPVRGRRLALLIVRTPLTRLADR